MSESESKTGESVLEPKLTKWDERVLATLGEWPKDYDLSVPMPWMSAWAVAEKLREDDVKFVRSTLAALVHFGYATARGFDHRQVWLRLPEKREALDD